MIHFFLLFSKNWLCHVNETNSRAVSSIGFQADILSVPDPEGETAENVPQGKPHYICDGDDDDDDGNPIPKKATKSIHLILQIL